MTFRILLGVIAIALANSTAAITLNVGDIYTSPSNSNTINHYSGDGTLIDSLLLPSELGSDVRGLTFGPNGLLYAVTETGSGYSVHTIDNAGIVTEVASGSTYIAGNLGYGKVAVAASGRIYVTGQGQLTTFGPGDSVGTVIYNANQVHDVEILPTGNLLVLSAYDLVEITPDGTFVREITPGISLVDGRGVEYDAATDSIYLSMLGFSGNFHSLMRLDGATGQIEISETFNYAIDLFFTSEGQLLIGSWTQNAALLNSDLGDLMSLPGGPQMFVTQMQTPVPLPAGLVLFGSALSALLVARKR